MLCIVLVSNVNDLIGHPIEPFLVSADTHACAETGTLLYSIDTLFT